MGSIVKGEVIGNQWCGLQENLTVSGTRARPPKPDRCLQRHTWADFWRLCSQGLGPEQEAQLRLALVPKALFAYVSFYRKHFRSFGARSPNPEKAGNGQGGLKLDLKNISYCVTSQPRHTEGSLHGSEVSSKHSIKTKMLLL